MTGQRSALRRSNSVLALVNGLRTSYERAGEGPPLLLLHGWANSALTLEPLARALGDLRQTIVPDLPGFGRSERPKPPQGWNTADYAAWALLLLDKLGIERADLFGHSHGARVAIQLAAEHPERAGRLILAGAAGLPAYASPAARLAGAGRSLLLQTVHRAAARGLLGADGPEQARALSERLASADYRAAGAMRPTMARVLVDDLTPLLPRIAAPTLLLWGAHDTETPVELGLRMERLIRGARLLVLPDAGHHVFSDSPEPAVAAIRDFLKA
jgi:pimeloyl-ACP methyl ester carboxylesterase